MIRSLIVTCCLVAISTSLFAEAKLVHAPEYVPGKEIRSEIEINVDQTLSIGGMDVETGSEVFLVMTEKVREVSPDQIVLDGKMEVMQTNISLPGGQSANFDSGNADAEIPAGPLAEVLKFMKGLSESKWVTTLDNKGYVVSQKYPDEFLNSVPEMMKSEVSGEQRKLDQKKMIDRLPGKTVSIGDTWERSEEANLGSGQKFYLTQKFTYAGPIEKDGRTYEKITYETQNVDFAITGGAIPVEVKDTDLKIESSTATMLYDPQAKAIAEVDDNMHITGDLTLIINGMDLPSTLDLEMHTVAKTTSSVESE